MYAQLLSIVFCLVFLECRSKLIGAGGSLESATNTVYLFNYLVYRHTDRQSGNALCVARAPSVEGNGLNDSVLKLEIDCAGANARCTIGEAFHVSRPFKKYSIRIYCFVLSER